MRPNKKSEKQKAAIAARTEYFQILRSAEYVKLDPPEFWGYTYDIRIREDVLRSKRGEGLAEALELVKIKPIKQKKKENPDFFKISGDFAGLRNKIIEIHSLPYKKLKDIPEHLQKFFNVRYSRHYKTLRVNLDFRAHELQVRRKKYYRDKARILDPEKESRVKFLREFLWGKGQNSKYLPKRGSTRWGRVSPTGEKKLKQKEMKEVLNDALA